MKLENAITQKLRSEGQRITPARARVISFFAEGGIFDALALSEKLLLDGLNLNKTTIYRELDFLQSRGIIQEITVGGSRKLYELVGHHHHIVCSGCQKVACLPSGEVEEALKKYEDLAANKTDFIITHHHLTMNGLCQNCVTSN